MNPIKDLILLEIEPKKVCTGTYSTRKGKEICKNREKCKAYKSHIENPNDYENTINVVIQNVSWFRTCDYHVLK